MGIIPKIEDWSIHVNFLTQIEEVKNLSIKEIKISQADIDLAKIQGRDIEKLKKELLIQEKNKKILQIKKKFGIKEEIPESLTMEQDPLKDQENHKKKLWDLLELKGFTKK